MRKRIKRCIKLVATIGFISYGLYVYRINTDDFVMNTDNNKLIQNLEQENSLYQDKQVDSTIVESALIPVSNLNNQQNDLDLYATSAILLDAASKRILYEKNGFKKMPMASTTKIMTLIVTLENANLDDVVTVSSYAARMPDVQLNLRTGEKYILKDLLYSLMLESHNDSAVAIAEHVGGSVEGFATMMNQKAKDIGCNDTYFITPNGLDATDAKGTHSTTAVDLARIMSYCIKDSPKREDYLTITRTANHSFQDIDRKRSFSCNNHNAFLNMMAGALSGKTGFTGNAGYCYVGALEKDDRTFVVALLACGWPNHKTWKWSDTKKLMNYGLDNFEYQEVFEKEKQFEPVLVENGQAGIGKDAYVEIGFNLLEEEKSLKLLLRKDEEVSVKYDIPSILEAPIKEKETVGSVKYYLGEEELCEYPLYTFGEVKKIDYMWCLKQTLNQFFE